MNDWSKGLLFGILVGFAAGAAVGLLYAPEKGRRTRRQLVKRAERLSARASDVIESAEDLIEAGRKKIAS